MSRLIRIFTVSLVILIFIPIIQKRKKQGRCPNLDDCPNLPDFTLLLWISMCFSLFLPSQFLYILGFNGGPRMYIIINDVPFFGLIKTDFH